MSINGIDLGRIGMASLGLAVASASALGQATTRASVSSAGIQSIFGAREPSLSDDGRHIAFSAFDGLVPGDTNQRWDALLHDLQTGSTTVISWGHSGVLANDHSGEPDISANGQILAFASAATNLVTGDTNGMSDVFVHDRANATTARVSVSSGGVEADGGSGDAVLSADGRFVAFSSDATNLVAGDTNASLDTFVRDRVAGITGRVSVSSLGAQQFTGYAYATGISGDGRYVVFASTATDLVVPDANGADTDVFVRDTLAGATILASRATGGAQANSHSDEGAISADGGWLAFQSLASNLAPSDTNGYADVFLRNLATGVTVRVSLGAGGVQPNDDCRTPSVSYQGNFVAFTSKASNLVAGDTNGKCDVFLRDVAAGTLSRESVSSAGNQGSVSAHGNGAHTVDLSLDARFLAFTTDFEGLVAGDSNNTYDCHLRDRLSTCAPVEAYCTPKLNSSACFPRIGASGQPHVTGPDVFFVTATNVLRLKAGLFLWGPLPSATPFGGGLLCVGGALRRTPAQVSSPYFTYPCSSSYSFHFSQAYAAAHALTVGSQVFGQYWSRDNGFPAPNNVGLTDALRFTLCP